MSTQNRIFEIYLRLNNGDHLSVKELAEEFGKSKRTIFRDMAEIGETVSKISYYDVELRSTQGKFYLSKTENFDERYLYVLSKILVASRGLLKSQMQAILEELFGLVGRKKSYWLKASLEEELAYYQDTQWDKSKIDYLFEIERHIQEKQVLQFTYADHFKDGQVWDDDKVDVITRPVSVMPISIFFNDYYFYLRAYEGERLKTFQINWMTALPDNNNNNNNNFPAFSDKQNRQSAAFLRYHTHYAYHEGERIHLKFESYNQIRWIEKRFPDAVFTKLEKKNPMAWANYPVHLVEMEVYYNSGLLKWLLENGSGFRVLEPQQVIDDLKMELSKSLAYYGDLPD